MSLLHTLSDAAWNCKHTDDNVMQALESGKVVFLPQLNFKLEPHEVKLISPNFSNTKDKNISYDILKDAVKGFSKPAKNRKDIQQAFKHFLKRYAQTVSGFIDQLLPKYMPYLEIGRSSFRPIEILGRKSPSYRKDDTRLHVDAFPSNPNHGKRLLRIFSNINPDGKPRCWKVGAPFEEVAATFLPQISKPLVMSQAVLKTLKITKTKRTHYDHIMLNIHNKMKKDVDYQQTVPHALIDFPAHSSWMVFTDSVSHAALSGQHVLEQTFYLDPAGMQNPALSPLKILEKMTGERLV